MRGGEGARAARAGHPNLPIGFVTGYAESTQIEGALGSEVAVLRKPFSLSQLEATVEEHLSKTAETRASQPS